MLSLNSFKPVQLQPKFGAGFINKPNFDDTLSTLIERGYTETTKTDSKKFKRTTLLSPHNREKTINSHFIELEQRTGDKFLVISAREALGEFSGEPQIIESLADVIEVKPYKETASPRELYSSFDAFVTKAKK